MPKTLLITALLLGVIMIAQLTFAQQAQGNLKQTIEQAGEGFKSILYTTVSEVWRYVSLAVGVATMIVALYAVFVQRRSWLWLIGEAVFLAFLFGLPYWIGAAATIFNVPSDKVAEWQCAFAGYIFYDQFCGKGGTGTSTVTPVG